MEKTAMIFAAGLGTRLRPLTDTRPKALVEVGGKPLLWHTLHRLEAAGYRHIVINVHHFASMIEEWLDGNPFPELGIDVSEEEELLDTGGGILAAEKFLGGCGSFLVHNVDILSDADLGKLEKAHGESLATLLVSDRKTSRYLLFDKEMELSGWTSLATGEVRSPHPGLDPARCRRLAFSGIHILSDGIFDAFREEGLSGKFPIMDFYISSCSKYDIRGFEERDLRLLDVGKKETLAEAQSFIEKINQEI